MHPQHFQKKYYKSDFFELTHCKGSEFRSAMYGGGPVTHVFCTMPSRVLVVVLFCHACFEITFPSTSAMLKA